MFHVFLTPRVVHPVHGILHSRSVAFPALMAAQLVTQMANATKLAITNVVIVPVVQITAFNAHLPRS